MHSHTALPSSHPALQDCSISDELFQPASIRSNNKLITNIIIQDNIKVSSFAAIFMLLLNQGADKINKSCPFHLTTETKSQSVLASWILILFFSLRLSLALVLKSTGGCYARILPFKGHYNFHYDFQKQRLLQDEAESRSFLVHQLHLLSIGICFANNSDLNN